MKKIQKLILTSMLLGVFTFGFLAFSAPSNVSAAGSTGQLVIKKLDKYNRPVAGSKFNITYVTGQFAKQVTTDQTGTAKTLLPVGYYNITDATAVAAGEYRGNTMYYVEVVAFTTQTVSFDNAYRSLNGIY